MGSTEPQLTGAAGPDPDLSEANKAVAEAIREAETAANPGKGAHEAEDPLDLPAADAPPADPSAGTWPPADPPSGPPSPGGPPTA